jgi:hypothetical protein
VNSAFRIWIGKLSRGLFERPRTGDHIFPDLGGEWHPADDMLERVRRCKQEVRAGLQILPVFDPPALSLDSEGGSRAI